MTTTCQLVSQVTGKRLQDAAKPNTHLEHVELIAEFYATPMKAVALGFSKGNSWAEDVLQSIYVKLLEQPALLDAIDLFTDDAHVRKQNLSWLRTITRNFALDVLRSEKSRATIEESTSSDDPLFLATVDRGSTPEQIVLAEELLRHIVEYFARYEGQIGVMVLRMRMAGVRNSEIAEKLNISEAHASTLHRRERKKLEEWINEQE